LPHLPQSAAPAGSGFLAALENAATKACIKNHDKLTISSANVQSGHLSRHLSASFGIPEWLMRA
jgi:hypothetical protein